VVQAGRIFLGQGFDLVGHELRDRARAAATEGRYLECDPYRQVAGGVSLTFSIDLPPTWPGRRDPRAVSDW